MENNKIKKIIGIDIGGTTVKAAVISGDGKIICSQSIPTRVGGNGDLLCGDIVGLVNDLLSKTDSIKSAIAGVGIGCPGVIDSKRGMVIFSGNLELKNCRLASKVAERTGMSVKITNDANAAALGEARFGAGKKYKNSILVTLGTGVGGGILIDGKLFEGGYSAGTEIGHTVIVQNGLQCTCGRRGCFERYASARALTEQTRTAMEEDKHSKMWEGYNFETVSGKTAFDYMDTDVTAKAVVDKYISHLACGIVNLINVFRPEAVMLGGGVSEQGERLTMPLQQLVNKEIFAGTDYAPAKIIKAKLGNSAGVFGAAALFL